MSAKNLRLVAANIINEVQCGSSLSDRLSFHLSTISDVRDKAFVQAICYGVCRFYTRLTALLHLLLKKPIKTKDQDINALLLVGLYQMTAMRLPPHAAVAETVNAAAALNKPWARGLVNAVLREYLRKTEELEAKLAQNEEAIFAHPAWWIAEIKKAWPDVWQSILNENNAHPPFALRVNKNRQSRAQYLQELKTRNHQAWIIPETQNGIILEAPIPVTDLPGFSSGFVSIQDGAAQLAAELLDLAPNLTVLDACSAPGGKLTHILELEPNLSACIAVEKDPVRLQSIQENLKREKLKAVCICADITDENNWWNGKLFDRILLDAPCSASGVIRRHPDIKLLRRQSDIDVLANEQLRLMNSLWPLLKPGGVLVYATCSVFPKENEQVLQRFLDTHTDAIECPIQASWGIERVIGRQILPGMHAMDGFYYAKLEKK